MLVIPLLSDREEIANLANKSSCSHFVSGLFKTAIQMVCILTHDGYESFLYLVLQSNLKRGARQINMCEAFCCSAETGMLLTRDDYES